MSARAHRMADREAGFTLLDALVALAILALVLSVVPRGIAGARAMQAHSDEALEARLVAGLVLEQRLGLGGLRPGLYGGEIAGRRWRAELTPHPGAAPARREGEERRRLLLDARITVAMEGGPLELGTLLIGEVP